MRIRIIIDTEDADSTEAIEAEAPFTLNAYGDDDDGTPSREMLTLGPDDCIIGGSIPAMLEELARYWRAKTVLDQEGVPLPATLTDGE